ncbi:MAG: exosortase/archaeosortase family protein [Mycobacteriales bacterium]
MSSVAAAGRFGSIAPAVRWARTEVRGLSPALRVVLVVGLVILAYPHSLAAVLGQLGYDSPLAYVGLVPLLSLGLCLLLGGRARPGELRAPDRQVDWILGVFFLAVAGFVAVVLPTRVSYEFWVNRLDLLGLPVFVAGLVAILFGSRVLHRVRLPVALLALAWPYPYQAPVAEAQSLTSHLTVAALKASHSLVPAAHWLGGTLFAVGTGAGSFSVNVAPSCAGADSALGFLLVGGAVLVATTGRRLAKLAWLVTGIAAALAANVVRLLLLMWTGAHLGEGVALTWLHPVLGLALFSVVVAVMVLLLPRFGLDLVVGVPATAVEAGRPAPAPVNVVSRLSVGGLGVLLVVAALFGVANEGLARFDPFTGLSSAGAVSPLAPQPPTIAGWTGGQYDQITWATPYFGTGSTWYRDVYSPDSPATEHYYGAVYLDVVTTPDLEAFSTFGLNACYHFHGFRVVRSVRVDVGGPAVGEAISYLDPHTDQVWSVVAWVWPVSTPQGKQFERVVALASPGRGTPALAALRQTSGVLVGFAREVVAGRERPAQRV